MTRILLLTLLATMLCGALLMPKGTRAQDVGPSPSVPAATPPPLPEPPGVATAAPTSENEADPTSDALPDEDVPPDDAYPDEDIPSDDYPYEDDYPDEEWTPERTPTPRANERPDGAEPNNSREDAKPLPLDAVSGPFTFLPEGDQDWYSVDMGAQQTGLPLEISVRGSSGLDLVTTVYRADGWTPLAIISAEAISATLPTTLTGWLLLKVDNRAPELADGETYRVEIRRTLPLPPTPLPVTQERPVVLPDALENNWNFAIAAPAGVGVVYELTFACPDPQPGACLRGDHDYLRFPVKQGLRYLLTTFDLGPGVDTTLDLFYGSEAQPISSNDDERPQSSFLSTLRWIAPADGEAVVRIGPRSGGLTPLAFDDDPGTYRFAIALQGTPLAAQLEERIAEQTNTPTPTPTIAPISTALPEEDPWVGEPLSPAPVDVPPQPPSPIEATIETTTEEAKDGTAVVITSTVLRTAPRADAELLEALPPEAIVTLLGKVHGAWVRAETATGVAPGWIYAPDLRRLQPSPTPSDDTEASPPPLQGTTPTPGGDELRVTPLDPLPAPTSGPRPERVTRSVTVRLVAAPPPSSSATRPVPSATPPVPLAGIRVQLVDAFGEVLSEAVTPSSGELVLQQELTPSDAVGIRIPAVGIDARINWDEPILTIALPVNKGSAGAPTL
jgi:hypothetical protein